MSAGSSLARGGVATLLAALLLFCSALVGCSGSEEPGEEEAVLLGILVSPQDVIVPLGGDLQLYATGIYDDRSSRDLTSVVQWESTNASVIEVSNRLDEEGAAKALTAGEASVEATLDGVVSVPVRLMVTDAELVSISLEPDAIQLEKGQTLQLTAQAAYSDGTRGDATTQVRWVTADGTVATLERSGLLEAVGAGETTIHASLDGLESSKVEVQVVSSGQADLSVQDLTLEPGEDGFTVSLRIKNQGTAAATGFFVDLFVNPYQTPGPGDMGELYDIIEYVGPGESTTVTFTVEIEPGDHSVTVVLDSDGYVTESNESNNQATGVVTVGSSTVGPNLTVTYFSYQATSDMVYYFVDVTNTGGEDVGSFYVDLFYDSISPPSTKEDGDQWTQVVSLGAGETTYADFYVPVSSLEQVCSYCWSWVTVDSYEEISETNENDNVEGSITVSY